MRTLLLAFSLLFILTGLSASSLAAETKSTTVLEGEVHVDKDRKGNITVVSVKTDKGSLLVPTSLISAFSAYDGRKVKVCCSVEGKNVVPMCVTGIVQARKVSCGRLIR